MSKARPVSTAIEVEGRSPAEVVAAYGVSRSWLHELVARPRAEADAAFEPRPGALAVPRGPPPRRPSNWCCGCASNCRGRPGRRRRRRDDRLAPDPPPPDHAVAGH